MGATTDNINVLVEERRYEEAARLLVASRRFEEAGNTYLYLLPRSLTEVSKLRQGARRAAFQAAVCFERCGHHDRAVGLFVGLGQLDRAEALLHRLGRLEDAAVARKGWAVTGTPWPPGYLSSSVEPEEPKRLTGAQALEDSELLARKSHHEEALSLLLDVEPDDPGFGECIRKGIRLAWDHDLASLELFAVCQPFLLADSGAWVEDDASVLYMLGRMAMQLGEPKLARTAFEAVLQLVDSFGDTEQRLVAAQASVEQARHAGERGERGERAGVQGLRDGAWSSSEALVHVGSIVNERYRIEELLGRGGYALVFRAMDLEIGEPIALKLFNRNIKDSSSIARFKQEMRIARSLVHPNIVATYEFGTWLGVYFITMELLLGVDLYDLADSAGGQLSLERAAPLLDQAFAGLGHAHDQGIIHRDLKPQNLFVQAGSQCLKVMDFGIAEATSRVGMHTRTGRIVGTPSYIAPERLRRSAHANSPSVDIYSLGVLTYQLLTGLVPFDDSDIGELFQAVTTEDPIPPSRFTPGLGPVVDDFVLRLIARNPKERFQSCDEVREALAELVVLRSRTGKPPSR